MPAILSVASFWRIVVTASFAILLAVITLVLRSKRLSAAERVEACKTIGKIAGLLAAIAKGLN